MADDFATLVVQIGRLLRRNFDERARQIGVTRPQWQVLSLLVKHEGMNQGGLADMLEVEPITVARMIDRMEDARLVERRRDPADRRAWRIHMTARGAALAEELRPHGTQTVEEALVGLDMGEREALVSLLGKVRANLVRREGDEAGAQTGRGGA